MDKICILSSVPVTLKSFYSILVNRLKEAGFKVILISSDASELNRLGAKLDCEVFATPILRRISPLKDILTILRLWRYLRGQKSDIIHAHTPKGGYIGMIASWLAFVPNRVYTVHGLVLETATGLKRKLLWLAEWLSCRLATQVLAVSPSLRHCVIEERICPADKIRVLGAGTACGIDLEVFKLSADLIKKGEDIRNKYNIPRDAIVIGFVGRVVPDKGIEELVDAFELLQKDISNAYLFIIGEHETVREVLSDRIKAAINNNDHIYSNNGFIDDITPFYAAMDIMTLPSKREGFGLTLAEASAMELPVIATKVTGCVDAVADNISGILIKPGDVTEFYKVMLKLAADSGLRNKLGKQGRQRAEKLFDSERLISEHIRLYKTILGKNKP
ncbi:MAG: glycosyltransferase family 4 protein [Sedimentisphaerales bacterium]|nr:glycosyltransferase family 4 protein [Sedimentisphaerales bacterium]